MNEELYDRVLLVLKHKNQHFSDDLKQITDNVNLVFGTNYSIEDISKVIGKIYEEQFNYRHVTI